MKHLRKGRRIIPSITFISVLKLIDIWKIDIATLDKSARGDKKSVLLIDEKDETTVSDKKRRDLVI